jgi:1,4-alpha-glucan branching enzyme
MKSGTTSEYATKRVTDALARFNYLYESVRTGKIDERYLASLEFMDKIFPSVNFRDYGV